MSVSFSRAGVAGSSTLAEPGPRVKPITFGAMGMDLSAVVELLERRRDEGWHTCAQVYVSTRRGGAPRRGGGRDPPRAGGADRRRDALVLGGQAADDGGGAAAVGAGPPRPRRPSRHVPAGLGRGEGALHAAPRAHPHRRVPDVGRRGLRPRRELRRVARCDRRRAGAVGARDGGGVPRGERLAGARRRRRGGGRAPDRAVPGGGGVRPGRDDLVVARDPARRSRPSSGTGSSPWSGPATSSRPATPTAGSAWSRTRSTGGTTSRGTSRRSSRAAACAARPASWAGSTRRCSVTGRRCSSPARSR